MDYHVLGPLEAVGREGRLPLGGPHQRAILALLLLNAGRVVATGRLMEAVWGERPPRTAAKALHNSVSQLRKLLGSEGAAAILTRPPGYVLDLRADGLDLERFRALAREGREALAEGRMPRASEQLEAALALWRGPVLSDLGTTTFPGEEIARVEELRVATEIDAIEAALALGHDADLVPRLETLVEEQPFEERLRAQLVLALYRSGRQADALASYQDARRTLVSELGIEPGPNLKELEREILSQDPALEVHHVRPVRPAPRRSTALAMGVVALAAVVAIVAGVIVARGGSEAPRARLAPNEAARVEVDTARVATRTAVGGRPFAIASGDAGTWVASAGSRTIERVDVSDEASTHMLTGVPGGIAVGFGSVWVTDELRGALDRVSASGRLLARLETGGVPGAVAAGAGAVWVADVSAGRVLRVDPAANEITDRIRVGREPNDVAVGGGMVWVADRVARSVTPIDPVARRRGRAVRLAFAPFRLAFGAGRLWVTGAAADAVASIEPRAHISTITISGVGNGPRGVAVGGGSVWIANSLDHAIARLDPRTGAVSERIRTGAPPDGLVYADGALWLTAHAP
jgi:DNA-binding SARP family transcriptional activator/streptogramin lyase